MSLLLHYPTMSVARSSSATRMTSASSSSTSSFVATGGIGGIGATDRRCTRPMMYSYHTYVPPALNHITRHSILTSTKAVKVPSVYVATETFDEELELSGLDAAPGLSDLIDEKETVQTPRQPKHQLKTYGPNVHVTATGRIVAIGDIHGDIQKLVDCLLIAGLIAQDADGIRWTGENATVVQLGDVLDRGDAEISTVLLLRELNKQAKMHGGAVHMLNGNHESLNVAGDFRYVTPGAFWESAMAAGLDESAARSSNDAVLQARWSLYRPGGVMAKELSQNPTVLIVNDEIVFAHGGLLPHHVKYGIQRINDEVARWMRGADCTDGSSPSPPFTAMGDSNSVMWNRTFGKERCSPYDRMQMKMQLDATLEELGAKAMVVGHTPQMNGLNAECNGRIWRVDVGMSSGVLGAEAQVLEFSKDEGTGDLLASLLTRGATPYL